MDKRLETLEVNLSSSSKRMEDRCDQRMQKMAEVQSEEFTAIRSAIQALGVRLEEIMYGNSNSEPGIKIEQDRARSWMNLHKDWHDAWARRKWAAVIGVGLSVPAYVLKEGIAHWIGWK